MRGTATVLTVAFVFASTALLVGPTSAQSSEPSRPDAMPEPYEQPPTDATIVGRVLDGAGKPVAGATVSAYNHGPVRTMEDGDGSSGSGSSGDARIAPYYGGNSTTTDSSGAFRLGVYSGMNQVSAHRDGYASASAEVPVEAGQTVGQDLTVQKHPDKTARIEGRVTDARTGDGIGTAYVSVSSPRYGLHECSVQEGQAGGGAEGKPMPASDAATSIVAPDSVPGCAITVHPDGTFDGLVTPGYSIVYVSAYSECYATTDADGASRGSCGPQYFAWTRTLELAGNGTTAVDAELRSHPAPDATVSGYLVDAETGQAIPGAQISFSNQEAYGYGYATTDGDGSYRLRLRSGYHTVSVWAPGHLPWEGTLDVGAGSSDFDVLLAPGEPSYGGCCIAYARSGAAELAAADSAAAPGAAPSAGGAESADGDDARQQVLYEDLGGGLGPYDAAKREDARPGGEEEAQETSGNGIPAPGALLALAAVLGLALLLRRRQA